ncbi:TerB family tellurite resistance protein [Larsenimonas salina]|uniref:tellurite resistance TerB family protein n=1 Tax=Larsenimonas salina TaxID=1295565 RepID=UPI00207364BF|nr:TerB family tellurite resistance protein [Larsenimonas salina]MCM5703600.1 TerB family tellurite resistance protein [Larsenimonas salina]
MFQKIQRFFDQMIVMRDAHGGTEISLELATAALLCEVVRADHAIEESEIVAMEAMLKRRFSLDEQALDELMALAREESEAAVDHYQFVRLINEHCSFEQKFELVRAMWTLAYADGEIDPLEEARIRTLSTLLFLSHSDFIRAKFAAKPE